MVTVYDGAMAREIMINSQELQPVPFTAPALGELLQSICENIPMPDRPVGKLRLSSASVEPGDVFIALPGMTADGRDYIPQAVSQGASAVLFEADGSSLESGLEADTAIVAVSGLKPRVGEIASRYFGYPSRNLEVVGITGTNGKTTVAYILAQALESRGSRCGYIGTLGTGLLDSLSESTHTTLDAITAQSRLRDLLDAGASHVAMEVSSHGLDQGRANGIDFDVAVFTNLTQDHLDYHGTMSSYGDAKRKLFEFGSLSHAVINADDAHGRDLVSYCESRNLPCLEFGNSEADLVPAGLDLDVRGTRFTVQYQSRSWVMESRLIGEVNVPNILALVGVLLSLNWRMEDIVAVMPGLDPPPGRMEVFGGDGQGPVVVVDYAHTPDALERALKSLRPLCDGRLITVFGCGGDRDQDKRPKMGQAAQAMSDLCIVTDDNPRTEPPEQITGHILGGMDADTRVVHDRIEATRAAIALAGPGDVILLAGKGHEGYQDVGDVVLNLSDRDFVPELLAGWEA